MGREYVEFNQNKVGMMTMMRMGTLPISCDGLQSGFGLEEFVFEKKEIGGRGTIAK